MIKHATFCDPGSFRHTTVVVLTWRKRKLLVSGLEMNCRNLDIRTYSLPVGDVLDPRVVVPKKERNRRHLASERKSPGATFKPAINSIKRKESLARAHSGSKVASFSRRLLEKRLATGSKVAYNKNAATGMVRQPVKRSRSI